MTARRGVRPGVFAALLCASAAHAGPQLEASGFVGVGYLSEEIQLGDSWAPEQVPGTAPVVGARLNVLAFPDLVSQNGLRVSLGIETELALATAFTGGTSVGDGGRMTYFAPVLGWRAHVLARISGSENAQLHLVVGAGGETVASSSPYMRKETDPVFYWGPGISIPVGDGAWHVRIDARHGLMAARSGGVTSTIEVQFGVATTFGLPQHKRAARVRTEPVAAQPVVDEHDGDGDGLPDRLDRCPTEPETPNGIDDADGCPEPDADGDRVIGAADRCPDQAEDRDGFEDDDGCPDLDNDGDGIEDVRDRCPNQAEVRNGIADDDGCPDAVPVEVTKILAGTGKLKFETNRARVTADAKQALAATIGLLQQQPTLRIVVIAHPYTAASEDLARRRADAVKWHLIDAGMIAEDRIEARVGDVKKAPTIELQLLVR